MSLCQFPPIIVVAAANDRCHWNAPPFQFAEYLTVPLENSLLGNTQPAEDHPENIDSCIVQHDVWTGLHKSFLQRLADNFQIGLILKAIRQGDIEVTYFFLKG